MLLILWVHLFAGEGAFAGGPNGKSFEADFAMFVAAGSVLEAGGNPYDSAALYRAEHAWLARQHLPITEKRAIVRVGNPPLFFWMLEPLGNVGFSVAGLIWAGVLYLVSLAGFLLLLRHLGWRLRVIPALIFLLMPQVLLGAYYGNVVALVFFAVCLAIVSVGRFPILAGILLAAAWMKPPVALPVALLVFLFYAKRRRPVAAGFAAATWAGIAATVLITGAHSITLWLGGMFRYSRDIMYSPDISSLAGLYVRSADANVRTGLEGLSILTACVLTYVMWRRTRDESMTPELTVGWLWVLWFLATPYAHFFDEILLTLPVLALMSRDGAAVARRDQAVSLYLLFFSLLFIEWAPDGVQLLSLPLVALTLILEKAGRAYRRNGHVARQAA